MFKRTIAGDYLDKAEIRTRAHAAPLFKLPRSDTKVFDRSIIIKGGTEWNNLSVDIRNIKTYDKFKLSQKKWLNTMIPN